MYMQVVMTDNFQIFERENSTSGFFLMMDLCASVLCLNDLLTSRIFLQKAPMFWQPSLIINSGRIRIELTRTFNVGGRLTYL